MPNVSTSNDQSQISVEQSILEAEVLSAQLRLKLQFNQNMQFFKQHNRFIYDDYVNHVPKNQKIFYDLKGYINLLNIASQNPAYDEEPKAFAKNQVEQYLNAPMRFRIGFKKDNIWNKRHIHLPIINSLLSEYEVKNINLSDYERGETLGLVVMVGCGMGYQLEALVEQADVRNVFIYDGNKDSFYASLYTIDWKKLTETIKSRGGKLRVSIGTSHFEGLSRIRKLSREISLHNLLSNFVYQHTNSKENDEFIKKYRKDFHFNGTAKGFYDDEQVSFAHTVHNVQTNIPLFNPYHKNKTPLALPPVLIVGNGPSLDIAVDFIKKNKDNVIIVSCGSAITSLYKLGIVPDFQIVMERELSNHEWIALGTDLEFTKQVTLIALNNVAPKVTELFKDSYMAIKPNDIGNYMIAKEINSRRLFELPMCNPTVTNCGISWALCSGFTQVILIGTDFGMADKNKHHSEQTIHLDVEKSRKEAFDPETGQDYNYARDQYTVKGNFCNEVTTVSTLDMSRRNVEILLESFPEVSCFNTSNGAFIQYAQPTRLEDIPNIPPLDNKKNTVCKKLLSRLFFKMNLNHFNHEYVEQTYLNNIFKIKEGLTLPELCHDRNSLYQHIERIYNNLEKIKQADPVTYMLINGSIEVNLAVVYAYCKNIVDPETFSSCYQIGRQYYDKMINAIYESISQEPFRLDDTVI